MTDLKTAAYQADDVLDDFRYEALRRRATRIRPHPTASKVLDYFTVNNPIVFRLCISRKMKDALQMIDELVMEMNTFQFLQHAEAPAGVHPQTHSHVNESEIVGRHDEKEQVVKLLLDHAQNNNNDNINVMVLPIVGMGGIGKTTLAQLVHNDQRVAHHFELVIWVCVSDKFVIEEIIRSIIQVATMTKCELTEMEALQKNLSRVLGKKRYLLVLDDVWNEDGHKWDAIRLLLCSHATSGSAIVVTSRSDKVASIMGTLPPHQISLLDEDQSWGLFHRNTFERGVESQEELISVAKSIVQKCKGFPLAIKTIAALLRSRHQSQWLSVMDSDVWKDDILPTTGMVPALELSYYHLSSEAKVCFSFCAIFPKDSPMDKDMLIQLWMANDFITSEASGQQIFDVLLSRCFLQYVDFQVTYASHTLDTFIRRPITCNMHDLMHDLAQFVSGNDCSFLQDCRGTSPLQHKVQHLSLDYISNDSIAAIKESIALRPRTMLDQWEGWGGSVTHLSMSASKFRSLRALKTRSIITHMTNLKHLRYLDCSYSDVSTLPEAITTLYSLQTLKLMACQFLRKLPEGMRYMSSLRHILIFGCDNLERMPHGIGQLNSLRTLTGYVIDSDVGRGIDQLKDLNLGGVLCLTELRKVHSADNAKEGNISSKHNLKHLSLNWGNTSYIYGGSEVHGNAEEILDALHPHKRLEILRLDNFPGTKLSSWMHNSTLLEHLSELSMSGLKNCKDLPPLWQLPSLTKIGLAGFDSLISLCIGNDDTCNVGSCISPLPFFPKLKTMSVGYMPKLETWQQEVTGHVAVVSFPQLKRLAICGCPKLASLPKMPSLENLSLQDLGSLTSICFCNDDNEFNSCSSPPHFFPKLETMIVSEMPKLERWHQEAAGEVANVSFPRLNKLHISKCPMLESMPKMLPLLEDLAVKEAKHIPLYHMMNLSVQSNLGCKGDIKVKPTGAWGSIGDLHLSSLGDSDVSLSLNGLTENVGNFEEGLEGIPCRLIKTLDISCDLHFSRLGDSDVSLGLNGLTENVGNFEEELKGIPCKFIKSLHISGYDYPFSSEPSQIRHNIWNHFDFVQLMWIADCNNIVQWPAVGFRSMDHLEILSLSGCPNFTGSLPSTISNDEYVLHPQLKFLRIENCGKLVEVPKLPASVERLHIVGCPKLEPMPTILGNIKKLRELSLRFCDALTTFPDGMYGINSLKKLEIEMCSMVDTLPDGLLQQLPALKELSITDCPNLEEAFSRGGAYWDLVEAIPKISVGAQDQLSPKISWMMPLSP